MAGDSEAWSKRPATGKGEDWRPVLEQLRAQAVHIDQEGVYPEDTLRALGTQGAYLIRGFDRTEVRRRRLSLLEAVSAVCVSTAFLAWCQTAAVHYVAAGDSIALKQAVLPGLETGQLLGGSGLSNPMKWAAGMESLRLTAEPAGGGFVLHGVLPFVSNVGRTHWFAVVANRRADPPLMMMVRGDMPGLTLREHRDFAGLNGTRTFTCHFDHVYVPATWVLHRDARHFLAMLRPDFLLSQAGLGLGLTGAIVQSLHRLRRKQAGTNGYLPLQPDQLAHRWESLRQLAYALAQDPALDQRMEELRALRREIAELALAAAQTEVLYRGAAGYFKHSSAMRRLHEALFLAIVTPAVKQLYREQALATVGQ